MECLICHSNNIKTITVNEEIVNNNNIINVPITIPVCKDCGERYYDRKTVKYLEDIQQKIKNNKISYKETGKILTIAS